MKEKQAKLPSPEHPISTELGQSCPSRAMD